MRVVGVRKWSIVCLEHSVSTMYSASVEDKAMVCCFCAAYVIVPPSRMKL